MARMGNFVAGDPALARASSALAKTIFGDPATEARLYAAGAQYQSGLAQADRYDAAAAIDRDRLARRQQITAEVTRRALEGDVGSLAALIASSAGAGDNADQTMSGVRTGAGLGISLQRTPDGQLSDNAIRQGAAVGGKPINLNEGVSAAEVVGAQDAAYRRAIDERTLRERGATERNAADNRTRVTVAGMEPITASAGGVTLISPSHPLYGQVKGGRVYGPATQSTVMGGVLSRVASGRGSAADQMLAMPPVATAPGNAVVGVPGDPRNRAGVLPPVNTPAGAVASFDPTDPRATGPTRAAPPTPSQSRAGGAGADRAPLDVSPADVKGLTELLGARIPAGYTLPAPLQNEIMTRATAYYQSTRDAAAAIDAAFSEVMGGSPRSVGNWNPMVANEFLPTDGYTAPPRRAAAPGGAAGAVVAPPAAAAAPAPATAARPLPKPRSQADVNAIMAEANAAIAAGKDPNAVRARLREMGIEVQ